VAWPCVNAYGYPSAKRPHRLIVGVATLEDVRPLTERELWKMDRNFNNLTSRQMHEHPERIEIYAFEIGYFFVNPIRFETPVPFAWPPGPLKPIFTEIRPGSAIGRQLRAAGIRAAA
jgi:hypothetical protein